MSGRGVDLSGGAGTIDLSGGGGSSVPEPSSGAAHSSAGIAGSPGMAPGGGPQAGNYAGAMGASVAAAALQNPQVQDHIKAKAGELGAQGWEAAKVGGYEAATELHKYVQEGPAGISILCFLGGGATSIIGAIGMLNVGKIFSDPFHYVLSCYLTVFGLITVLLEADVEKLQGRNVVGKLVPLCEHYQMEIFERAKFLTELRGRGFFYTFVGTLAVTQCVVCLYFLCGLWNLLMGILCLLMSFGINPADHLPASNTGPGHYPQQGATQGFNQSPGFGQNPNYGPVGYGPGGHGP